VGNFSEQIWGVSDERRQYLVAELFWPSEDAYKASVATPEMAALCPHAQGCGTTFTTYAGDVAEV
jgi:hypothetical protein